MCCLLSAKPTLAHLVKHLGKGTKHSPESILFPLLVYCHHMCTKHLWYIFGLVFWFNFNRKTLTSWIWSFLPNVFVPLWRLVTVFPLHCSNFFNLNASLWVYSVNKWRKQSHSIHKVSHDTKFLFWSGWSALYWKGLSTNFKHEFQCNIWVQKLYMNGVFQSRKQTLMMSSGLWLGYGTYDLQFLTESMGYKLGVWNLKVEGISNEHRYVLEAVIAISLEN